MRSTGNRSEYRVSNCERIESHTFVVPTFGESPFLRDCLASLRAQELSSKVIVSTSSAFPGLSSLVDHYGAELHVHAMGRGIGVDWNAALDLVETSWVTIAHQDDVYAPTYTMRMLRAVSQQPEVLIAFCAATEIRGDSPAAVTMHMRIKRVLTEFAFLGRSTIARAGQKRRLLAFGNPIVCPSVMINLRSVPGFRFREDLGSNLDWAAWLNLARRRGRFGYVRDALLAQRTHSLAATTHAIADGMRRVEDEKIFAEIWPPPMASLVSRAYRLSYRNRKPLNDGK